MSRRFICILLITTVSCVLSENTIEDKSLTNMVRVINSTKIPYPKGNDSELHDKSLDKQSRTTNHRLDPESKDDCCGAKYSFSTSTRPFSYNSKVPGEGGRYSSKYGERLPADRYGWQTQGQPPGWSGSSGRPGSGSYVESTLYEVQTGDRFGSRPNYGSDNPRKPGGYESTISGGYGYGNGGYGAHGFSRPTGYGGSIGGGGYGISGTLANGDEFGGAEPNYPEENNPPHPNIQAQKAVALKALAGVALIGAAAALATNPILLPIGIVSGRRKRSSLSVKEEDFYIDYIFKALKANSTKVYDNEGGNKITVSPICIARLTCEIQKRYWPELKKKDKYYKERKELERRYTELISSNILHADYIDERIKKLIKAATVVASIGGQCNMFACTFIKTTEAKNRSILKI